MYNRYIPQEEDYIPVVPPPENPPPSPPRADRAGGQSAPGSSVLSALGLGNLGGLFSGAEGLVSRLLPDNVDAGDILLRLIVLYRLAAGGGLDLVIARGLTLVLIAHDLPMVQHISDRIIEL